MIKSKQKFRPGLLIAFVLLSLTFLTAWEAVPAQAQVAAQAQASSEPTAPSGPLRAPGQIVVKFKPGFQLDGLTSPLAAPPEIQPLLARLGVTRLRSLGDGTNVFLLYFPGPVDAALQVAGADPAVVKADANEIVRLEAAPTPNDPLYAEGKQWWLDRVQAPAAWEITTGSKDILVGVVDDGVDASHPDLAGKVVAAYNFAEETPRSRPGLEGHATSVAGCITANTNNGTGLSGLAWNVSLIDGKGFGELLFGFSFDLARGNIFAINQGARVINNSWGGRSANLAVIEMIEYAASKNVIIVASSGNSGFNEANYPASFSRTYPNVIAVGATDYNDKVVGFSTFGPQVNVVAPGSGIWTAQPGEGYRAINGTSFSAPIVTGIVALMLSVNPNLRPIEVRNILEGTADDISGEGYTLKTGYGRVNAYKAVLAVKNNDLNPGKRNSLKIKVAGVDPAKVRLSLDPLGLSFKLDGTGQVQLDGLGRGTYRLRATVAGQGTVYGPVEVKFTESGGLLSIEFALQNLKTDSASPDNWVDQARFFDARPNLALAGAFYFAPTGHSLAGSFRQYWEEHGGLAVFGYPLSEEFQEISETDGQLHTVQYFQRNRFELHLENAGTAYEIQLGLLGSEGTRERSFPASTPAQGGRYFAATGQNLSGPFLQYWEAQGGLALFGYPISPVMEENGRQVQYFQRNRFELHPEIADQNYRVLLGLLGTSLAQRRGYI